MPAPSTASIHIHEGVRTLVVEPAAVAADAPVLLFLHGRGEAGKSAGVLPRVLLHLSPPFRACLGQLTGATVVAPQAPYNPTKNRDWDWSPHIDSIHRFLQNNVSGRQILLCGFSRGGRGVLQLLTAYPDIVTRWSVLDPQPAEDVLAGENELPGTGWLAYGTRYGTIERFSERLANFVSPDNVLPTGLRSHGEVARRIFAGDAFKGRQSLYQFLGLEFERAAA